MSRLAVFRRLEKNLAEQIAALEAMKGDEGLKKEVEFETKLRDLLAQYGYSLQNVMAVLDPKASCCAPSATEFRSGTRKARQVKIYKSPNPGEVVEIKGGNHKVLEKWKAEYSSETVERWLVQ